MASTIRAGLIGLSEPSWAILTGMRSTSGMKVVGLADTDKERLADFAQSTELATYNDHRIMLLETRPKIVFINVPRYQEAELLNLAAELGVSVWKPYPLARNFDEAAGYVGKFAKANLGLYVGNPYRYSGGFAHIYNWLGRLGKVHLIQDEYMLPAAMGGEITGWRASKTQAGGGVLLEGAYPGLELITSQFGLPEQVYCLARGSLGVQTDRPYETEDLGMMSLAFGGGTVANSAALRVAAEASRQTVWHGAKGKLSLKGGAVSLQSTDGEIIEVRRFRDRLDKPYARQATELVHALRGEHAAASTAKEHLSAMAVIEAAYLSARTGQPESPSHFYELQDLPVPATPVISSPAL